MLNVSQGKIGALLQTTKINKIMAEDSLKMITFIEDVKLHIFYHYYRNIPKINNLDNWLI